MLRLSKVIVMLNIMPKFGAHYMIPSLMKKREQKVVALALVAALTASFVGLRSPHSQPTTDGPRHSKTIAHKAEKVTPSELYHLLIQERIPYPEVFLRVAITESGWRLNSQVASENHNFFGFIHPSGRFHYSEGERLGHAWYASPEDAVHDLRAWVNENPPATGEDPYSYLRRRHYNPNPGYYGYVASINICEEVPEACSTLRFASAATPQPMSAR